MKGSFSVKKIVVTGAKGKLSCKTAEWLNNKNDYSAKQMSLRNGIEEVNLDGVDSVVHIAGVTPQNVKSPDDYYKINTVLTEKLANKSKIQGVRHFVYISSMAVYGITQSIDQNGGQVNANTPCNPIDEYGKSKLRAEKSLVNLQDDRFKVCIIRVPSVFDEEKTEYTDQYKYLSDKLPFIPKAFTGNYKSFIHTNDLCELIYLVLENETGGVICPDDGEISAFDICRFISPHKPVSRISGKMIESFMRNNPRITDYYGAVYYSSSLTNVFGGKYRITDVRSAIGKIYEK